MQGGDLFPEGFHPVYTHCLPDGRRWAKPKSRILTALKYYYVDFGLAVRIIGNKESARVTGAFGQDRDPPELSWDTPYDPFKLDIFILGNVFRKQICAVSVHCQYFDIPLSKFCSRNTLTCAFCVPWRNP